MYKDVSGFMEKELLPPFFTQANLSHLIPFRTELAEFFKRVSLSLWQLDQSNFPYNAHEFCSTISRVVEKLTTSVGPREKVG